MSNVASSVIIPAIISVVTTTATVLSQQAAAKKAARPLDTPKDAREPTESALEIQRRRTRFARGRAATIFTGPLGVQEPIGGTRPTLGGGLA